MNTAEVRDALGRTGVLFTQHDGDFGHISDFWRATILALCDAFDELPRDAADLLHQERRDHSGTKEELTNALAEVESMRVRVASAKESKEKADADRDVAVQLVIDAVPRMQTLNNAMSPGWLTRASALLEG